MDWFTRQLQQERDKHAKNQKKWRAINSEKSRRFVRNWKNNNPERVRAHYLKRKYNISVEEWDTLFTLQGNACAICKTVNPGRGEWCVDHCHNTNRVRGILCHHCNRMLGYARDSVDALLSAAKYLQK